MSINEVLEHSVTATKILFDRKGLELIKDIRADLPLFSGDRGRIIQVVINLLSNAAKFTETGDVTVSAVIEGQDIVVRVTDTGLGVSEDEAHIIFDKFRQLGDVLTDKPRGSGLGLAISLEIMEHHGGSLWYEPAKGGGSVFGFSIPIKED